MVFVSYQEVKLSEACSSKVGTAFSVNKLNPNNQYVLTFYYGDNIVIGKCSVSTPPHPFHSEVFG